jgi:hypothetical protein
VSGELAVPASFRDPSGFVFVRDGQIFRQINVSYRECYDRLIASGLYDALTSSGLLVAHEEVAATAAVPDPFYKLIRPEPIPFISYPYEWSFGQLKDAALATLDIQVQALDHGMILKDASAYNIQFRECRPVLIDTLSFDIYQESQPWVAYRQFCQHFLAPLALMSLCDVTMGRLSQVFIDGVPLETARQLLPWRSRLHFGLLVHIHMHAKSQRKHGDDARSLPGNAPNRLSNSKLSLQSLRGIIDSLRSTVMKLQWQPAGTEWGDYYSDTNYTSDAMNAKRNLVAEFVSRVSPGTVWDLGANTGVFSRIASEQGAQTVAFDVDPAAVEKHYRDCVANKSRNLLPLVMDLTSPSPSIGWENRERDALTARGPVDLVLALALIHHLAIGNNVPLRRIASFFAQCGRRLIVEFVPKTDSQVQRLLASRADIFPAYTRACFEQEFSRYFSIEESRAIGGSERTLYLMRRT